MVSGGFTQNQAAKLAADLKAGSLSFTPRILSEQNVSADLGHKERIQGISAAGIALCAVIALMIGYYRFSGIIASVAVLFNLLIIWGVLQNLQATLTLSGIAGIILTVGMAVDSNVLVFERIREELKKSIPLPAAIFTGYKKAFGAIFDSNITTVIAAVILLHFDAGPVKGLAITLTIGIVSSMFTALFMTKTFFAYRLRSAKERTLSMADWFHTEKFRFLKYAKPVSAALLTVILIGGTALVAQYKTISGMDFTGGYSCTVQLKTSALSDTKESVEKALLAGGARPSEIQVRELNDSSRFRIQLASSLEEKGSPFYEMPSGEQEPRLRWIVESLDRSGLSLTEESLASLPENWSEMSGQFSKTTRNNALIGLSLALFFILIYISLRFEVKYALSAILCLLHDVCITLACMALLRLCGLSIQINMQVIAALMTIIGYSLNDTIIVFDRIREERKIKKKHSFTDVINHSLCATLNRTMMTSLTTFIVLLVLLLFGGSKIFDFSLIMCLGVVFGTLSSLFPAPLLLSYFHEREEKMKKNGSIGEVRSRFSE